MKNVGSTSATYTASASVPGFDVTVTPGDPHPGTRGDQDLHGHVHPERTPPSGPGPLVRSPGPAATHNVRSPDRPAAGRGRGAGRGARRRERQRLEDLQRDPGLHGHPRDDGLRPRRRHADRGQRRHRPLRHRPPRWPTPTPSIYHVDRARRHARRAFLAGRRQQHGRPRPVRLQGRSVLVDLSASGSGDEQVTLDRSGRRDLRRLRQRLRRGRCVPHLELRGPRLPRAGNGTVTPNPASVTQGTPATLSANWTGLDPAKRWFGVINYDTTDVFTYFSVG